MRVAQHQEGDYCKSYTYKRRPVELVFCEEFIHPNEAIGFEKQVKGWTRKKKEALIARNWGKLIELAECKILPLIRILKNRVVRGLRLRSA